MKNIIIVEGITDKYFLEGYLAYLQANFPRGYLLIDQIEYKAGQDSIFKILENSKIEINKGAVKNIGILIDANADGIASKIDTKINPAIERAFGKKGVIRIPNQKYQITFGASELSIFCHIINTNGKGELEDLLKEIRTWKEAPTPKCLDQFVACLTDFNEAYPEKEYKKNFIYFYGYDCMKKAGLPIEELKSTLKNGAYYLPPYWDFTHEKLNGLKQFLELFREF